MKGEDCVIVGDVWRTARSALTHNLLLEVGRFVGSFDASCAWLFRRHGQERFSGLLACLPLSRLSGAAITCLRAGVALSAWANATARRGKARPCAYVGSGQVVTEAEDAQRIFVAINKEGPDDDAHTSNAPAPDIG